MTRNTQVQWTIMVVMFLRRMVPLGRAFGIVTTADENLDRVHAVVPLDNVVPHYNPPHG